MFSYPDFSYMMNDSKDHHSDGQTAIKLTQTFPRKHYSFHKDAFVAS